MKLSRKIIEKNILKNFFTIDLSKTEEKIVHDSITTKYAPSVVSAIWTAILITPAVLFLNTTILATILIPVTMVTGTAWFAISLSSIKEKLEKFGLELTAFVFKSFTSSLMILALLVFFSFLPVIFAGISEWGAEQPLIQFISGILGIIAVFKIIWELFAGSVQYDVNDALLTGQDEAAELFFRRSLSNLHTAAELLRGEKQLEVANYYLGVAFYEVFEYAGPAVIRGGGGESTFQKAMSLRKQPNISQEQADAAIVELIEKFIQLCSNKDKKIIQENISIMQLELKAMKDNKDNKEKQALVDARFATILDRVSDLIQTQGEDLFQQQAKRPTIYNK